MNFSSVPWKVISSTVTANVLTEGWNLASLDVEVEQTRTFTVEVAFDSPFVSVPVVQLGLTGFDLDQRDSARLAVKAENITETGFTAVISTWSDSRVYAVSFNWFAIGA